MTYELLEDLTEQEALVLLTNLDERFGWSSLALTRDSVEHIFGRKLTDEDWDELRYSDEWHPNLGNLIYDGAVALVIDSVRKVLPDFHPREA